MNPVLNFLKGAAMGAADVVPGVSGGTVALLVGIYERLIQCITSFDRELITLLKKRQFSKALQHIDGVFLTTLLAGLVTGFVITVSTLAKLLEVDSSRALILAAFFGMIIAATLIVGRMIGRLSNQNLKTNLALASVGFAISLSIFFWQLGRDGGHVEASYGYLFVCGAIAICAMILPGISGALILILLGVYEPLVTRIKAFLKLEDFSENFVVCVCFGLGAVTGLLLFSRVLRRLLDRFAGQTLSLLCGLMVGSLPLLWPFQVNTTPGVEELKERVYKPVWPETLDSEFFKILGAGILAIVLVLVAEWLGGRANREDSAIETA